MSKRGKWSELSDLPTAFYAGVYRTLEVCMEHPIQALQQAAAVNTFDSREKGRTLIGNTPYDGTASATSFRCFSGEGVSRSIGKT